MSKRALRYTPWVWTLMVVALAAVAIPLSMLVRWWIGVVIVLASFVGVGLFIGFASKAQKRKTQK